MFSKFLNQLTRPGVIIRRLLLAWLTAAVVELVFLPAAVRTLVGTDALGQMSFPRLCIVLAAVFLGLSWFGHKLKPGFERWALVGLFGVLSAVSLVMTFRWAFLILCLLVLGILIVYAIWGWNREKPQRIQRQHSKRFWFWLTVGLAGGFALFVSVWTVCRVLTFSTPTYDFGIFSQMFHSMKTTGIPLTTVERDKLLSHFYVHMSPIYCLLLPVYYVFPYPATLQALQALILASSVLPLWKLARLHNLAAPQRTLLCAVALLLPVVSGGTSYDIHENCFLLPLLLWLLYGIDRKKLWIVVVTAILTCMVKEDAPVYVAVVGLWLFLRTVLRYRSKRRTQLLVSIGLMGFAVLWFVVATLFLSKFGDGVMTYRYNNFIFDGSASLLSVVKAVLMMPAKLLYECVDPEKLGYIFLTLAPLLGLPLLTRRYERFVLLIPYILVNLISDYKYQFDVLFQYNFGSTALLLYLTLVNLEDLKGDGKRLIALGCAAVISAGCFLSVIVPKAITYPKNAVKYAAYYKNVRDSLDLVPDGVPVAATTYYTTYLSQRDTLYDVRYTTKAHLLETEYVVLNVKNTGEYKNFATNEENGYENLVTFLEKNGYQLMHELENVLVIYHKPQG